MCYSASLGPFEPNLQVLEDVVGVRMRAAYDTRGGGVAYEAAGGTGVRSSRPRVVGVARQPSSKQSKLELEIRVEARARDGGGRAPHHAAWTKLCKLFLDGVVATK